MTTPIQPEPSVTEQVQPIASPVTPPPAPSEPPAPVDNRQDIYNRYQQTFYPSETPVVQPAESQQPEPPAAQPPVSADMAAALAAAAERITALEEQIRLAAQAPQPSAPTAAKGWIDYLKEGDAEGFQKAFVDTVRNEVQPKVQQQTVESAIELFRAEQEINSFVAETRQKNADISAMEPWVAMETQSRMAQAKVNSPQEFVTQYKSAVQAAIENARKIAAELRASGKQEAQTIHREVISASPLPPQSFSPDRGVVEKSAEPQMESPSDYLRKRLERQWAMKGLGPI